MRATVEQMQGECVVIDNGSTPALPELDVLLHIRLDKNYQFTGGWNRAMEILSTHYSHVWMLNSDLKDITPRMLRLLTSTFVHLPDCAALTPAYNSPHTEFHPHLNSEFRQVRWMDWSGPLVSMNWWQKVGGFDERFIGYGSDLDFSRRVRDLGGRFYVADNLIFHHMGSETALSEGNSDHVDVGLMERQLREKWGVEHWWQVIKDKLD